MKKYLLITLILTLVITRTLSFCGFYVAKAGAELFNNKSQVIVVRDGNKSTVTMSNDFKGNVKDFALVIPVPVVLKKENVSVIERDIFERLDAYSAPRLVEYYDENPCAPYAMYEKDMALTQRAMKKLDANVVQEESIEDYKVKIEAQYTIGEYDIVVLSAEESGGLKKWLIANGYKIPEHADRLLEPYIRSNNKFFVVKVNLEEMQKSAFNYLRPIQIRFDSPKFGLPIRLGMSNSEGEQDLLIYGFTRKGRIEAVNYRTVKIPTDRPIPLYVQKHFGKFYSDLYARAHDHENRNALFLEYAWNVSPFNSVKCDPCVSPPPVFDDFKTAGVDWISGMNDNSNVFFTRLHVRYSDAKFPQDLIFQVTPNSENFQARYILTHPATGDLTCEEGKNYLEDLILRRERETQELAALTGWDLENYDYYLNEYKNLQKNYERDQKKKNGFGASDAEDRTTGDRELILIVCAVLLTLMVAAAIRQLKRPN